MSGRNPKRIKQSRAEPQRWSELLPELLERIFSHLKLGDNVRASAVCKNWHSMACAVQEIHQSPWMMRLTASSDLFEFYDPINRKIHYVEFPELANSRACYNKDGWLLLYRDEDHTSFFFNPFTRELINLPKKPMNNMDVAFSAAPTSGDCIVFTLSYLHPDGITVNTCRPGETDWNAVTFWNTSTFHSVRWNKIVVCQGKFYGYNSTGWLVVYDPLKCTWDISFMHPPTCLAYWNTKFWCRGKFLTEYDGEIFLINTCSTKYPTLYKLDQTIQSWKEMKTLDGGTVFASSLTSHSRANALGLVRNSIYFPKVRFYGKRCIFYSLNNHRYYPGKKQYPAWIEENASDTIWIEPPKDFTGFT